MDHQKTGILIAARRNELGLTQKELAKQLNISDRTVSKWERGAGFPDISLLEPLAVALGLTLLELFRGERSPEPGLQVPKDETIREAVRGLKPEFKKTLQRLRRWLYLLAALFVCAALALIVLLLHPSTGIVFFTEEISPNQATRTCPFILITTQEYELCNRILADEAITSLRSDDALLILQKSTSSHYQDMVAIQGVPADNFTIEIVYHCIYITFSSGQHSCIIALFEDGHIEKTCTEYNASKNAKYVILNRDNTSFFQLNKKHNLLAPFYFS